MNEEILTLYETYFQNMDNCKIFINELMRHHCRFCYPEETVKLKHCKTIFLIFFGL